MKRTTKRILVLMLCTVLIFTSAHSIYSNTFTLEVQAAEVVITAEIGAAIIEYLWGLLLTAGLVEQVYTWSERALQINNVMDALAAYPEITADMTLNVTVNGKELEVTYDQYMTYLRDHVVDGTGAVQTNSEVFTVLSGGGGKNGGDKNHLVNFTFGMGLGYAFYKAVMTRGQNNSYGLTDDELATINSAVNDLTVVSDYSITGASQVCYRVNIQNPSDVARPYSAGVYLNFDIEKTWTGHINPNAEYATLYFQGTNEPYGLRYPSSHSYMPVAALVPSTEGSVTNGLWKYYFGQSYALMLIEFSPKMGGASSSNDYNNFSFQAYSLKACDNGRNGLNTEFIVLDTDDNIFSYHNVKGWDVQTLLKYGLGTTCHSVNKFFNIQYGANYLDLSIYGGESASMPLLIVNSVDELKTICDGLLNQWDNSVFVNYVGNTGEGIFNTNAYNRISESALSSLVEAILRGRAGTDAVIDAANEVDALREVEPARLPELYPDLYPEYLPEADPAEYPEVYPDYDPVTNPNPTPSKLPDPDRVVNAVVQPIINPNPNPTPNPDNGEESGKLDNSDLEGATFSLSEYFPFCVPFDLIRAFKLLTAEAEAPYWEIPFHVEFLGYTIDYTFVIDMSKFEMLAEIFRLCETIGFCVGLILLTRNIIRG